MTVPSPAQYDAAFQAARKVIDDTGYGNWVSDVHVRSLSNPVAEAVVAVQSNIPLLNPNQPLEPGA
jgi:hypothetical protein